MGAAGERAPAVLTRRRDFMTAPANMREASEASGTGSENRQMGQPVILTGLSAALQDMGSNVEQQPYSHEIAGGRPKTWAGQDPTRIQVTTELSWRSESV